MVFKSYFMHRKRLKLVAFLILGLGLSPFVASEWRMNPVDEPFSLNQTGANSNSLQFVLVEFKDPETGNWMPVNTDNLETGDAANFKYYYNRTNGSATALDYFRKGYWYASLQPTLNKGDAIKYNASGTVLHDGQTVSSGTVVNATEDLQVGNFDVEIQTDLSGELKAGSQVNMRVQVENISSSNLKTNSDTNVEVYFANSTYQSTTYELGNYDNQGDYFFNSQVYIPSNPGSDFVLHVEANSSGGNRSHGTTSRFIDTAPSVNGEIDEFSSEDGCATQNDVTRCEQGANISIEYNITSSTAEKVNLSVYGYNSSGKILLKHKELLNEESMFTTEVEMPDLNTSRYADEVGFHINASNQDRSTIDRKNVTLEMFTIQDRSSPTVYTGNNYDLNLFLGKPYSLEAYNKTRFTDVNVTVEDPEDNVVQNFSKSGLDYLPTSGVLQGTFYVNSTLLRGNYDVKVDASNIYNRTKTLESGFSVRSTDTTFDLQNEAVFSVNRLQMRTFYADVENLVEANNNLEYETSLPTGVRLLNTTIQLSPFEQDVLAFGVELSRLEDRTGTVRLTDPDTNYNETINVTVDAANCQIQSGSLCSETDRISLTATNTEDITDSISLRNVGPIDQNVEFNISVQGDISQVISFQGDKENLTLEDQKEIEMTFETDNEGDYEGEVIFTTENDTELDVPVSMEVDLGPGSGNFEGFNDTGSGLEASDITVSPSTVSLGTVYSGSAPSETIEIVNNGETQASPVAVTSSSFAITTTDVGSIPAGGTQRVIVTFNSINSRNGQIQVIAGPKQQQISVNADLQSRTGNQSSQEPEQGSSTESPESSENNGNQQGLGIPIIPIIGIVLLLILIGFVFFTSYVPEEGDPLYDVLRDKQ